MIVRCIANQRSALTPAERTLFDRFVHLEEVNLVVGRGYLVFGVAFHEGLPWYYLCEEKHDEYPKPHFGALLEVVDARVPPGWSYVGRCPNVGAPAVLPDEWASQPYLLERLVDGDADAVRDFVQLRERLRRWHGVVE
jgi:hypothetical protein